MSDEHTLEFDRAPSALAYMLVAALPGARRPEIVPDICARWRGHRVDRRALRRFFAVTGTPARSEVPLLYPHTFGFRLPMVVLTRPSFPVPIWGVLQIRNHFLQHRPIAASAVLDIETRVAAQRRVDKGTEFDLHTTVRAGGELCWESLLTFYVRGRHGEPQSPSPLADAPAPPGELLAEWTMADDAHWEFGRFTGDYNGIHVVDWYARRFGFARALYHPPRVLAQCLARIPGAEATRVRVDAWLKGPVHHGASVRMYAASRGHETLFALFAGADRPAIIGRVQGVEAGTRLFDGS